MIHQKRGGALRGLRINREILILRKPRTIECKRKRYYHTCNGIRYLVSY